MQTTPPSPHEQFLAELSRHLDDGSVSRLVFAKYSGPEAGLVRVTVRPLVLRNIASLSIVTSYTTKDITKNFEQSAGLEETKALMTSGFARIHLLTADEDLELAATKKGAWTLRRSRVSRDVVPSPTHDRPKVRSLSLDEPFLVELGITDRHHRLIPSMARKWRQITKFTEILEKAIEQSSLHEQSSVSAIDFGSGKGYLTFALHNLLATTLSKNASVLGVEVRPDLAEATESIARRFGFSTLSFVHGDIATFANTHVDIMVALHACDTATDHALHFGIANNAEIIVCSPCCHKEIRPQLTWPSPVEPMLRFGIHQGAQAEMLTDALRALLLESQGYDAKVFEFISPEETSKNKMILATKRPIPLSPGERAAIDNQVAELKSFYGITRHTLETLLHTR